MRTLFILIGLTAALALQAQQDQQFWITGTAVPGNTQKLEMVSANDFKYAGPLKAGELRVITTKKVGKNTQYLSPVVPDANVANHGIGFTVVTDITSEPWQVVVDDEHYRLHINPERKTLHGEICQPWGELFIGGGATASGWKEGKMQLMHQQTDNPYVWIWEGELKRHDGVEEPTSFKFQGQDRWYPKALHPYAQGTDILNDRRLRIGGDDTKWSITKDGVYRITIDIFNEKVQAELIK